jgi:TonB-linked SusC/RagA family outer membrane protein
MQSIAHLTRLHLTETNLQTLIMKRFLHPLRHQLLLLALALLLPAMVLGQTYRSVTGTVKSETNEAIPGVYVLVKGTTIGTTSDVDGKYTIEVPDNATLVFTFIGMKNVEESADNRSQIDVTMIADVAQLDEVVVVGYGTQRKADVTGSVASVSGKELSERPVNSLAQALQGRAAGVQVSQTSNAPGGGVSIRIRGGNSIQGGNEPLYVVDGYPLINESGSSINPNDIESIDILKDASATAIYGSRGANGVVIITTKRGKSGRNTVQFDAYYGVQQVRKKLDLLDATQLATLINEGIENVNQDNVGKPGFPKPPAYTQEAIDTMGKGTNWQDQIFRKAPQKNYQLTIAGGDDRNQYSISGNYFDQKGIVVNTGFSRASLRMNLDRKLSSKLKIGNSISFMRTKGNAVNTDGDGGSGAGVVYGALIFSPTVPVFNADGSYTIDNRPGAIKISNPVALAKLTTNETTVNRLLGNVSGEYEIIEGLKFKVLAGANLSSNKNGTYVPRTVYAGVGSNGSASVYNSQFAEWLNENTLSYNKTTGEHKITALLGYTMQQATFEDFRASAQNFANDILTYKNLGAAQQTNPGTSSASKWGLRSYIARVNYDFGGRYLVTLTSRVDGSSRFGKGNKNAFFPSGSVAWRISNEKFMTNISKISDLKIRASYGITGNQEINQYQSLSALGTANYNFNNALSIGYAPTRIANPNLKWETTAQTDIGIDLGLFTNRIVITADWYKKKTSDLLYNVPLPISSGYSTSLQNIGKVQNEGYELGINTVNVDRAFRWNTNFNISWNKNKIIDLGSVTGDVPAGQASGHLQLSNTGILRVGQPIGVFFGLRTDGIFQTQEEIDASAQKTAKIGDRKYQDIKVDGVINAEDRVILGYAQPKYIFGFSNTFSYKGIDLSVFIQGSQGNSVLNMNRFEQESMTGVANQSTAVLDRWTPTNHANTIPRATSGGAPYQISSRQVEDGSYIRLKNIQLAYNIPTELLKKIRLTNVKVYVTGQNLITITDYTGFDPEVSRFGQDNLSMGVDYGSYPTSKMFLCGINIGI